MKVHNLGLGLVLAQLYSRKFCILNSNIYHGFSIVFGCRVSVRACVYVCLCVFKLYLEKSIQTRCELCLSAP